VKLSYIQNGVRITKESKILVNNFNPFLNSESNNSEDSPKKEIKQKTKLIDEIKENSNSLQPIELVKVEKVKVEPVGTDGPSVVELVD